MRTILFTILLASLALTAPARTNSTRKLTDKQSALIEMQRISQGDTTTFVDRIHLSGYKKTLEDAYESFFVNNQTPFRLSKVTVRFVYTNAETGQRIEKATYNVTCDIPSGEMRQLTVRTFDKQHSFYFINGRKPRRAATPFRVKYDILGYDVHVSTTDE